MDELKAPHCKAHTDHKQLLYYAGELKPLELCLTFMNT